MDSKPLRILLIADFFGLDRATGAKRANAFAKYWAREPGVTVTALCAHKMDIPLNAEGTVDLGSDVREVRVRWPDLIGLRGRSPAGSKATTIAGGAQTQPDEPRRGPLRATLRFLSDLLVVPDRHAMWALGGVGRGSFLPRPDVIVATAPSFVNLVIARLLATRFGVPYVCDLRDPWHDNPFRPVQTGALLAWGSWLEKFALSRASRIWAATAEILDQYVVRPDLVTPDRITVVANGYDEEEWRDVVPSSARRDHIQILHAGNFYGVRSPVPFLEDLGRMLRDQTEPLSKPLRVRFVGACDPLLRRKIDAVCAKFGLEDTVSMEPSVELHHAVQAQVDTDLILLMGHRSDKPVTQIPLKLYEALRAGRPQLAYFQQNSSPAQFARRHPEFGIHLLDLDDPDNRPRRLEQLLRAYDRGIAPIDSKGVTAYERSELAARALADLRALVASTSAP